MMLKTILYEAWLKKPAQPCWQEEQAEFLEDKNICQFFSLKQMMKINEVKRRKEAKKFVLHKLLIVLVITSNLMENVRK